ALLLGEAPLEVGFDAGYGLIGALERPNGRYRQIAVHRLAYALAKGRVPIVRLVCSLRSLQAAPSSAPGRVTGRSVPRLPYTNASSCLQFSAVQSLLNAQSAATKALSPHTPATASVWPPSTRIASSGSSPATTG